MADNDLMGKSAAYAIDVDDSSDEEEQALPPLSPPIRAPVPSREEEEKRRQEREREEREREIERREVEERERIRKEVEERERERKEREEKRQKPKAYIPLSFGLQSSFHPSPLPDPLSSLRSPPPLSASPSHPHTNVGEGGVKEASPPLRSKIDVRGEGKGESVGMMKARKGEEERREKERQREGQKKRGGGEGEGSVSKKPRLPEFDQARSVQAPRLSHNAGQSTKNTVAAVHSASSPITPSLASDRGAPSKGTGVQTHANQYGQGEGSAARTAVAPAPITSRVGEAAREQVGIRKGKGGGVEKTAMPPPSSLPPPALSPARVQGEGGVRGGGSRQGEQREDDDEEEEEEEDGGAGLAEWMRQSCIYFRPSWLVLDNKMEAKMEECIQSMLAFESKLSQSRSPSPSFAFHHAKKEEEKAEVQLEVGEGEGEGGVDVPALVQLYLDIMALIMQSMCNGARVPLPPNLDKIEVLLTQEWDASKTSGHQIVDHFVTGLLAERCCHRLCEAYTSLRGGMWAVWTQKVPVGVLSMRLFDVSVCLQSHMQNEVRWLRGGMERWKESANAIVQKSRFYMINFETLESAFAMGARMKAVVSAGMRVQK